MNTACSNTQSTSQEQVDHSIPTSDAQTETLGAKDDCPRPGEVPGCTTELVGTTPSSHNAIAASPATLTPTLEPSASMSSRSETDVQEEIVGFFLGSPDRLKYGSMTADIDIQHSSWGIRLQHGGGAEPSLDCNQQASSVLSCPVLEQHGDEVSQSQLTSSHEHSVPKSITQKDSTLVTSIVDEGEDEDEDEYSDSEDDSDERDNMHDFLDKAGEFLLEALAAKIPDLQTRVNIILQLDRIMSLSRPNETEGIQSLPRGQSNQNVNPISERPTAADSRTTGTSGSGDLPGSSAARKRGLSTDGGGGDESDHEEDADGQPKRPRTQVFIEERFACWFVKRYPDREWKGVCRLGLGGGKGAANRFKYVSVENLHVSPWTLILTDSGSEHATRYHLLPPHCPRCFQKFDNDRQVNEHLRKDRFILCEEVETPDDFIGVSETMMLQLRNRTGIHKQSDSERWGRAYRILFDEDNTSGSCESFPQLRVYWGVVVLLCCCVVVSNKMQTSTFPSLMQDLSLNCTRVLNIH